MRARTLPVELGRLVELEPEASGSSGSGTLSDGGSTPNSGGGCSSGFGTAFGPWALVALSGLVWSRRRKPRE